MLKKDEFFPKGFNATDQKLNTKKTSFSKGTKSRGTILIYSKKLLYTFLC